MAKFFYRMQNILDIKYKLEEQAKQEYMAVRVRLNEAVSEFEEAISLVKLCNDVLSKAEQKVKLLVGDKDGSIFDVPFDADNYEA